MATGDRKARGVESSSSEPSCNPSANQRADVLRRARLAEDRRDRTASFAARRKTGLGVAPSVLETYDAQLRVLQRLALTFVKAPVAVGLIVAAGTTTSARTVPGHHFYGPRFHNHCRQGNMVLADVSSIAYSSNGHWR